MTPELEAIRKLRDALAIVLHHAPGYNWNADPLFLTLITGDAFQTAAPILNAAGVGREPIKVYADAAKDIARALGASIP